MVPFHQCTIFPCALCLFPPSPKLTSQLFSTPFIRLTLDESRHKLSQGYTSFLKTISLHKAI